MRFTGDVTRAAANELGIVIARIWTGRDGRAMKNLLLNRSRFSGIAVFRGTLSRNDGHLG